MSTDSGVPDGELAPQPTHISVHVHQESALAKLLLAGCSLLRLPGNASTLGPSRLLVASWVLQIALGVLSLVLGGLLCLNPFSSWQFLRPAIWTGVVALLAGAAAFLYEKRGGICWASLRGLLALAAFGTAIAAIAIGADSFQVCRYTTRDDVCQAGWGPDPTTSPSPKEATRLRQCISYLHMLRAMLMGLQAMLMSVWVLLLLASLVPLCLYFRKRFPCKKEGGRKLLASNSI